MNIPTPRALVGWLTQQIAAIWDTRAPVNPTQNRLNHRDLMREAFDGVGNRPLRLIITLVGTVLGIASLVATIGFAQTASGQIAQQFDELAATRVTLTPGTAEQAGHKKQATGIIPWDSVERTQALAGVQSAALYAPLPESTQVTAVQVLDPSAAQRSSPRVIAGSPELLTVVDASLRTGRFFDSGNEQRADRVAILGSGAAERLGINRISGQPAVFINDHAYSVIGIVEEVGTRSGLLDSVIVPIAIARAELGLTAVESLDIRIDVGAGPVVARQAPLALHPNDPTIFDVSAPNTASELRSSVQSDINALFLVIGIVALIGGGIGIANISLLSVAERRAEIGLRRALGARTRDIAHQFILEALTTGVLGGLIGAALGLFALIGVCLIQHWTPVIAPWAAPLGVVLGALVGIVAGVYPAHAAARIEPVEALRDS